eukprot:TRINITY_DN6888_c0_g1_i1.p1 TRINITY_DN6888_c0_g1~~TRINITY_DN6888_c0_g1_i1.p1  ORF type:complete len:608 (-),score=69.32 TRINITY_DN6888_c0_g1_i1:56-1825(-)
MTEIISAARHWISIDPDENTKSELKQIVDADPLALAPLFSGRLAFGTAGLRGKMGPGPNRMNNCIIMQTTQGIVKYLEELHADKAQGVVIGFDHRHNSNSFAETAAAVFLHSGWRVYMIGRPLPTPLVPWAIKELGAKMGVMVTASHNPKQDNGFKVYWENTAQIVSPHDKHIQRHILANLDPWTSYDFTIASTKCEQISEQLIASYLRVSVAQCRFAQAAATSHTQAANYQITYTAMHGVGTELFLRAWEAFELPGKPVLTTQQTSPDPDFPTVSFPNPEEKGALNIACATADQGGSTLVLANDPDADRLAVAVKSKSGEWKVLTGNEIALLIADWVWSNRKRQTHPGDSKPFMVASTVSSKVLQRMAHHEGFHFFETLTGFKWIGNKVAERISLGEEFLCAYEVEIGFLVGNMSLDKDGIRVGCLFASLAIAHNSSGIDLLTHLDSLYALYGYHEMSNKYFFCEDTVNMRGVFDTIRQRYEQGLPWSLDNDAKFQIVGVRDLERGFDSTTQDHVPVLPVDPSSHMITFYLSDGSVCTLRGSGTEPKLKYYVEVVAPVKSDATAKLAALEAHVVQQLLQPERFHLRSP